MTLDLKKAYLLLGSNLGDRALLLGEATQLISKKVGDVFAKSTIYETAAWGKTDQPSFLNLAIGVTTALSPLQLLNTVLEIENMLGRKRLEKWGARLIDIDIVLYADEIISQGYDLRIPHPEMQHRKFVLQPLAEIAPLAKHPVFKKTITEMLEDLTDFLTVEKIID